MTTFEYTPAMHAEILTIGKAVAGILKAATPIKDRMRGMDDETLTAYVKAARADCKATWKGDKGDKAAAVVSSLASQVRKEKGHKPQRAKGAGRKAKEPRADKVATTLSPLEQCDVALAHIVKVAPQIGASERKAFVARAMLALKNIKV